MARKVADLAVAVSVYQDAQGQQRKRWKNVGAVIAMDDGHEVMMLDTTFNPAGAYNPDGRERVALYRFDAREGEGDQPQQQRATTQQRPAQAQARSAARAVPDEDIPF